MLHCRNFGLALCVSSFDSFLIERDFKPMKAASEMEVAAVVETNTDAIGESRMPMGFIVFGGLALVAQVLWLGLIVWWLLNLF